MAFGGYDEDFHENPFFKTLVEKQRALFTKAEENRWTICVPRVDVVESLRLNKADFENHILRPLEGNQMKSVNDKVVTIETDTLQTGDGYKDNRTVHIILDELFYNQKEESYHIWCLDQPLEGGGASQQAVNTLRTFSDCRDYLWQKDTQSTQESVDGLVASLLSQRGSTSRNSVDLVDNTYAKCLQMITKNPTMRMHFLLGETKKRVMKLALETYIMEKLHSTLFPELCHSSAREDEAFNRVTRNLQDVQLHQLGIDKVFELNLKEAKEMLSKLNNVCTPMEKVACLTEGLAILSRTPADSAIAVAADELVPLAVFIILKSDIPNWVANLNYLTKFNPSRVMEDRNRYCLTTYEVALEYLRSGGLQSSEEVDNVNKHQVNMSLLDRSDSYNPSEDSSVAEFFAAVRDNDEKAVDSILNEKSSNNMCHPLCTCSKCEDSIKRLSNVPSARSRDKFGLTALHYAAKNGSIVLIELLIKHGAVVNDPDHNGLTPLHLACQRGHQMAILFLLDNKADINSTDSNQNTPLHLAASHGHNEAVKTLLFNNKGCNINAVNSDGNTPLHNASRWGFAPVVTSLLTQGADVDIVNSNNRTALDIAHSRVRDIILKKIQDKSLLGGSRELLQLEHRKHSRQRKGDREVNKLLKAAESGDVGLVRFLLEGNLSPSKEPPQLCHPVCQCPKCAPYTKAVLSANSHDSEGFTPLHKASLHGHTKIVEELIKFGANVDSLTSRAQHTPLHYACIYHHNEVVNVLLEHGANLNLTDNSGATPLHTCCTSGNISAARELLKHNVNVNARDSKGNTPLHQAAKWDTIELVKELMRHDVDSKIRNEDDLQAVDLAKDAAVRDVLGGRLHTGTSGLLTDQTEELKKCLTSSLNKSLT